jgi:hypothetical protein
LDELRDYHVARPTEIGGYQRHDAKWIPAPRFRGDKLRGNDAKEGHIAFAKRARMPSRKDGRGVKPDACSLKPDA